MCSRLGMERLSLALSYFPEVELALDVCGDAGSGRMYTDVKIQEWYTTSFSESK